MSNTIFKYTREVTLEELMEKYSFAQNYLEDNGLYNKDALNMTFKAYLDSIDGETAEDMALDKEAAEIGLVEFINNMKAFLGIEDNSVESLTIKAGYNKYGEEEGFGELTVHKSEIISIVGPTGSGKSRLLGDIEWTAMGDTPTGRSILINGEEPDKKWRFSSNNKLVAQLSQNMNFVMDLQVEEFVRLHAESRLVEDIDGVTEKIMVEANKLAGEQFSKDTPITALSGGQSRALMIADTAILSSSPIVLLDEIENAGIDRKKALELLVSSDKIVLMATHDPTLALIADRRIVINNGGIVKIIETSAEEKEMLEELEKIDKVVQDMRISLRYGEIIDRNLINSAYETLA